MDGDHLVSILIPRIPNKSQSSDVSIERNCGVRYPSWQIIFLQIISFYQPFLIIYPRISHAPRIDGCITHSQNCPITMAGYNVIFPTHSWLNSSSSSNSPTFLFAVKPTIWGWFRMIYPKSPPKWMANTQKLPNFVAPLVSGVSDAVCKKKKK